jgi:hypothetical protein
VILSLALCRFHNRRSTQDGSEGYRGIVMQEETSKDMKRALRRTRKGKKPHSLDKFSFDEAEERTLPHWKKGGRPIKRARRPDEEEISYDEVDEILDEQQDEFLDDLMDG